jgi:pantoate--beta-alanine ligase
VKIIRSVAEMQSYGIRMLRQGQSVGLVPTMGALHAGHLSLVKRARDENDVAVISIFVNPMQFGPKEDFSRYPRAFAQDKKLLEREHVDVLFAPDAKEMYPEGFSTVVDVPALSRGLCGPFRPGHFRGVCTVVAKLFNIVEPTRAYFGEKDYQQLRIIKQMADDLRFPMRIIGCPTVRESDGLAASSRNRRLSAKEREESVKLYQTLFLGRELITQKIMLDPKRLQRRLMQVISTIPKVKVDYISVVDPETLESMKRIRRPAVLAAAIYVGKTRLIDNVLIS